MVRERESRCGAAVCYLLRPYSEDIYENGAEIFLDFEHVLPSDSERCLFQLLDKVLEEALKQERDLENYEFGASTEIRNALQNPNDMEAQRIAFNVVSKYVVRVKAYYDLAMKIEQVVPNLLWELCSGPLPPAEQIDSAQALCKQLARVMDFVLRFDALKMVTPALQNDFSFYRRVISRSSTSRDEEVVPLEIANTISLFLANPTPMLHCLTNATLSFVQKHPDLPMSNTTDTLATIVYLCRHMLERKDFYDRLTRDAQEFFLRVMVGALILYDHIDENGAFCRQSPIDLRAVVNVIRQKPNPEQGERLINALKYTSKHFNDPLTPKATKALFN